MRNHKSRARINRQNNRMNGGFGARLVGGRTVKQPERIEVGDVLWQRIGPGTYGIMGYGRDMTEEEAAAIERSLSDRRTVACALRTAWLGEFQVCWFDR